MTQQNGTHDFRFYLSPHHILQMARLPEEFTVKTVLWSDDRQAFCFVAEGPHTDKFFVPLNEVLPIHAPAVTVMQTDLGDHLKIEFPQFEET